MTNLSIWTIRRMQQTKRELRSIGRAANITAASLHPSITVRKAGLRTDGTHERALQGPPTVVPSVRAAYYKVFCAHDKPLWRTCMQCHRNAAEAAKNASAILGV